MQANTNDPKSLPGRRKFVKSAGIAAAGAYMAAAHGAATAQAAPVAPTGIRMEIHEGMTEEYILDAAAAVRKVAQHYAV